MACAIGVVLLGGSALLTSSPVGAQQRVSAADAANAAALPNVAYSVVRPAFFSYYTQHGGNRTYGQPLSNDFQLLGLRVQIFQNQVVQQHPDGSVSGMDLLTKAFPLTHADGATFPTAEQDMVDNTPALSSPTYQDDALAAIDGGWLDESAPDTWSDLPVNFNATFRGTVTCDDLPAGVPCDDHALLAAALDVWGLPISGPTQDPNDPNKVYQRFQRGIMQFTANDGITQPVPIGDLFRRVLQDQNVSDDLRADMTGSRFLAEYSASVPLGVARPLELPATSLAAAFGSPSANDSSAVASATPTAATSVFGSGVPSFATPAAATTSFSSSCTTQQSGTTTQQSGTTVAGTGTTQQQFGTPVAGTGTTSQFGTPVAGTGTQPQLGTPVASTGTTAQFGTPVASTGTTSQLGTPVAGTGTTQQQFGTPVAGTGTTSQFGTPVAGTGTQPQLGTPVASTGTTAQPSTPVASTGTTSACAATSPAGAAGTSGAAPQAATGPDPCAGDEQIMFAPNKPYANTDVLVSVTSARHHAASTVRLTGPVKSGPVNERQGLSGWVWEWTITPAVEGWYDFSFYTDGARKCATSGFNVLPAFGVTSTPTPISGSGTSVQVSNTGVFATVTPVPTATPVGGPSITAADPPAGACAGTLVHLTGTNFGATQTELQGTVILNIPGGSKPAAIQQWTNTSILLSLPAPLAAGPYQILVTTTGGISNALTYTVGAC